MLNDALWRARRVKLNLIALVCVTQGIRMQRDGCLYQCVTRPEVFLPYTQTVSGGQRKAWGATSAFLL